MPNRLVGCKNPVGDVVCAASQHHCADSCVFPDLFQGLDVLIKCGAVGNTPASIAAFVIEAQQHAMATRTICNILTPQRFAGVLSSEAAWKAAKPTAVAYLKSYDFTGMTLCQALRTLLWRTSVPQSTRSVSFLLRMFSARYFATAVANDSTLAHYFPSHGTCHSSGNWAFFLHVQTDLFSRLRVPTHVRLLHSKQRRTFRGPQSRIQDDTRTIHREPCRCVETNT
jgi:hypothetical protein